MLLWLYKSPIEHPCTPPYAQNVPMPSLPPAAAHTRTGSCCRVAQVVCWLEALAAQQLQEAPAARFAHHEGLWRETLLSFGLASKTPAASSAASTPGATGAAAGSVTELDPDAPSRAKVKLSQGDLRGEERLASHLWQLIRAGEAAEQVACRNMLRRTLIV
jgi:hypothetical protein